MITQPLSCLLQNFIFLYVSQLHFPRLIFNLHFISSEIPLGILNSVFLSLVNSFVTTVASLILRHMMLSHLSGHLCISYKTKIKYVSFLYWKKSIFLSRLLLYFPQFLYSLFELFFTNPYFIFSTLFKHICPSML